MSHPLEHQDLVLRFIPSCNEKTILDIGCGKGIWGYLIRSLKEGYNGYMVGIDLSRKYLRFVRRFRVYDDLILCDASLSPFRPKTFDFVIAAEVIEHIPKSNAFQLINNLKKIAKERVLTTTPNGVYFQGALDGVQSQRHLSTWSVSNLKRFGFHVRGYGFRFVRPTKVPFIYGLLDNIFTPISYILPYVARFLIAYYDVKAKIV